MGMLFDVLFEAASVDVDALVDAGYRATLGRCFSADSAKIETWEFRVGVHATYSGKPAVVRVYVMGFRDAVAPRVVKLAPALPTMELD